MRSTSAAESGSVAAEFAIVVPAVAVVLALSLGAVSIAGAQVRAQDAAADAARTLGRGGTAAAVAQHLERQAPGATFRSWNDGDLLCVRVELPVAGPAAALGIRPAASSCALAGGR